MKCLFRNLFLIATFLTALKAQATLKIVGVSGVSFSEQDTNGNFTVYGGIAGACSADGYSSGVPCNSCLSAAVGPLIDACNMQSVYPGLSITITFTSDQAITNGLVTITTDAGITATEAATFPGLPNQTNIPAQQVMSATFNWSYLCGNDSTAFNSSCVPIDTAADEVSFANSARKIYLGVDENSNGTIEATEKINFPVHLHYVKVDGSLAAQTFTTQTFCNAPDISATGLCGFKLGIGDSKFYLQEVYGANTGGTVPAQTPVGPPWYGVALFAVPAAVATISNSSVSPVVRPYTASYSIDDNTVTGLENYRNYCLVMANINKAQNIYKYNILSTNPADVCAEPSEVIGLLSDKSCFISTAAFGSDMAKQVQLLRKFRDQFLVPSQTGRSLVKFYYKVSPPLAHYIEHSEILKSITRTFLYPIIGFAWLSVQFGFFVTMFGSIFLMIAIYFIFRKKRRASHA